MEWFISQETLRRVPDAPDLDLTDITFVADKKMQFPAKQRLRLGKSSAHSSSGTGSIAGVSPLSVICATMTQALRGKNGFAVRLRHAASIPEVDLDGVQRRSLDALIKLLDLLVRRLPQAVTLVYIIEGVVLFERDKLLDDALRIFGYLLAFIAHQSVPATVKVLSASTQGRHVVQVAFENGDVILNIDILPQLEWAPNDERVAMQLGGVLGGDVY
ncbi:hypothetical protein SCARD494_01564 [Seiridium cardinale]